MSRRTPESRYREKTRAQALYDLDEARERVSALEAILGELIAWNDTGVTKPRVWARARDLLQKPE